MTETEPKNDAYRLPYDAVPHRYDLVLTPNLEKSIFDGTEQIELEILKATDRIVLNAIELEITNAAIRSDDKEDITLLIEFDVEQERVTFVAPHILEPGQYRLTCNFAGTLNDKLCGFYRSSFTDDSGEERVIATTQFESTDARRAFPCFDEPDRKAIFSVTLDAPQGMLALSNGAEIGFEELLDGTRRVRFSDTIKMSTYLVCFIVGPLEATDPVDVDGVSLRVVHLPGKSHLTAPAIQIAAHSLGFYGDYFGIPYPSDKLDLVAIPDFAAGAMENLGCVTFREAILLADPDNVSQVEMERLAEVVEHEIAHMWFGDLVTMGWWNGIWLNEAFATYMSLLCQDDYRPEWQCFVSFARGRSAALLVDGLHATRPIEFEVRHPDESSAMFDVLTYEKGASVLWMIDTYLGANRFRDGVRRYLEAHAYANTETSDLWDAIEQEADDVPIRAIMDSWIFQGGYPLVQVSQSGDQVELSQQPFAYLPSSKAELDESAIGSGWLVPVLAASINSSEQPSRVLLSGANATFSPSSSPCLFNAGGAGFYRLHYDATMRDSLLGAFASLAPLERYNYISDTWAVILSGNADIKEFFDVIPSLESERDPHVWSTVIGALGLIALTAPEADRETLRTFTTSLLAPQLERIGWEKTPGEDDQAPVLRSSLIGALGSIGEDQGVIAHARELFDVEHTTDHSIDADLISVVLNLVSAHAKREEFETILRRYRDPRSPMDQVRHLNALASLRDVDMASEVHDMCLGEVRSQNAPYLLGGMLHSRFIGPKTWSFVVARFDELVERFPETSVHRMLEGVTGLADLDEHGEPVYFEEIRSFLLERIEGGRRRLIAQSIEQLDVNIRFAQRLRGSLKQALPQL